MKKTLLPVFALFLGGLALMGAGCASEKPLTEVEQAEAKGLSLEEYQDTKEAAARMNMGVDDHMNME